MIYLSKEQTESCGLICRQFSIRVYVQMICADTTGPCQVAKWVALRGEGPPCGGRTALDKKARIFSSTDHETCTLTWLNEGRMPRFLGWSSHYTPVLDAWLLAYPAPPWRSLPTLWRDRACFILLCAFLCLPNMSWQVLPEKEPGLVYNMVILRLYYQSLERDAKREKIQSEGESAVLARGYEHSEGAQK